MEVALPSVRTIVSRPTAGGDAETDQHGAKEMMQHGTKEMMQHGTKEMMQPCLTDLHVISLIAQRGLQRPG